MFLFWNLILAPAAGNLQGKTEEGLPWVVFGEGGNWSMDLGCLHQADGGGVQEAGGDGRRDGKGWREEGEDDGRVSPLQGACEAHGLGGGVRGPAWEGGQAPRGGRLQRWDVAHVQGVLSLPEMELHQQGQWAEDEPWVQRMPGSRVHSKQEGWKEVAPEKPGSSEARPVQGLPGGRWGTSRRNPSWEAWCSSWLNSRFFEQTSLENQTAGWMKKRKREKMH